MLKVTVAVVFDREFKLDQEKNDSTPLRQYDSFLGTKPEVKNAVQFYNEQKHCLWPSHNSKNS